jgi:hypothetical protein
MADRIPDFEQLLADLEQNRFPPHIATLPVDDDTKRAFAMYERCVMIQRWGLIPVMPKDIRAAFWKSGLGFQKKLDLMHMAHNKDMLSYNNSWYWHFAGPLYYCTTPMWRKGLLLVCAMLLVSAVLGSLGAVGIEAIQAAVAPARETGATTAVFGVTIGVKTLVGLGMTISCFLGLFLGFGHIIAPAVTYDTYRLTVKKESFLW